MNTNKKKGFKIAGWICLVVGIILIISAISQANSCAGQFSQFSRGLSNSWGYDPGPSDYEKSIIFTSVLGWVLAISGGILLYLGYKKETNENASARIANWKIRCEKCDRLTDSTAVFCEHCGEKIAEKNLCPNCGSEISKSSAFCMKCGQRGRLDCKE